MSPSPRAVLAVFISILVPLGLARTPDPSQSTSTPTVSETLRTPQEAPASRPAESRATTRKAAEPFEQSVPGCTVKLRMIPLPAAPDAKVQIYVASTETTWDVYDVFVFGSVFFKEYKSVIVDVL